MSSQISNTNTQNMATVYYLGGIKNDLSNQWNSLLNISNLSSACVNADLKIDNNSYYAGGNIMPDTNPINDLILIADGSTGFSVGDLVLFNLNDATTATYIVAEVDSDGKVEKLLFVSGDSSNIQGTTSTDGGVVLSAENHQPVANTSPLDWDTSSASGYQNGDYVQLSQDNSGSSGAVLQISAVDASTGAVTAATVDTNNAGSGYEEGMVIFGTSTTGRGAAFVVQTLEDSGTGSIATVSVLTGSAGWGYSENEQVTIVPADGQAAIYAIYINDSVYSFIQIYGGLNYNKSNTITVQTNGAGTGIDTVSFDTDSSIVSLGDSNANIGLASYAAQYWAGEVNDELRIVNGASTSNSYVNSLDTGDTNTPSALEKAIEYWQYGINDCLQSLMLSMSGTSPSIYDTAGGSITIDTELSSASVAPYMFNAANDQTQVGIMMKNKALADYGDFLQNQARAWNMLLANLTYGPTTMFNINNVAPFITQLNNLGNAINAFSNELDIVYVQIRSGTYSVANNAANLQQSYNSVVTQVSDTASALTTLREALTK